MKAATWEEINKIGLVDVYFEQICVIDNRDITASTV